MALRQLSVFLENRKGRLETIARILGEAGINIRGLSVADTEEFGILRLIVEQSEKAEQALRSAGISVHSNEVTAVEIGQEPGSLAKLCAALNGVDVNVEYMYALAVPLRKNAILILRFNQPLPAREALHRQGFRLLSEEDLQV